MTPTGSHMAVSAASASTSAGVQASGIRRNDGQYNPCDPEEGGVHASQGLWLTDAPAESWVEIASQPSSSSLSSIAADEIVITGLRIGSSDIGINGGAMPQRRRRLLQQVDAASYPTFSPTAVPAAPPSMAALSSAGSSHEEYEETESEEDRDRAVSRSTQNTDVRRSHAFPMLQSQVPRMHQRTAASDGDDEEDASDDDEGTALGMPTPSRPTSHPSNQTDPPTFRPQPNAFSHPPNHSQPHRSLPSPPHQHLGPPYARSMPQRSSQARAARNSAPSFMSPSYREDNDAALRASLTTLLSCAAAARGLPTKKGGSHSGTYSGEPSGRTGGVRLGNQPMDFCLVPESELMGEDSSVSPRTRTPFQPPRMPPPPQSSSSHAAVGKQAQNQTTEVRTHSSRNSAVSATTAVSTSSKSKRASANKATSSPRVTKKKRTASAATVIDGGDGAVAFVSPTLLTWVVSAGVVVLVSVVGFGAGFVIGREVGRQETASAAAAMAPGGGISGASFADSGAMAANATSSCGREIMRSSTGSTLRRFRWGAGMTKSITA